MIVLFKGFRLKYCKLRMTRLGINIQSKVKFNCKKRLLHKLKLAQNNDKVRAKEFL